MILRPRDKDFLLELLEELLVETEATAKTSDDAAEDAEILRAVINRVKHIPTE